MIPFVKSEIEEIPFYSQCGDLKSNPLKCAVRSPPISENGHTECSKDVNTEESENFESQLHWSSKSHVLGAADLWTERRTISS